MPTVLRIGPYRFQFYATDINEPPHVHVKRDRAQTKVRLDPQVRLESQRGFAAHEINVILRLVVEHREFLLREWHAYFRR